MSPEDVRKAQDARYKAGVVYSRLDTWSENWGAKKRPSKQALADAEERYMQACLECEEVEAEYNKQHPFGLGGRR